MSSLFQLIFGCCFGRSASPKDPESQRLIPDDELDPMLPHEIAVQPLPPVRGDSEALAELLRDIESKMVNVQDPHPFVLRPPIMGYHASPSPSQSRTPSPARSSHAQDLESASERSHSLGINNLPMRPPVLNMRLINLRDSPFDIKNARGRGRDRTRIKDGSLVGSPILGNGLDLVSSKWPFVTDTLAGQDADLLKIATLSASDETLLSNLSSDVRKALTNGFQMHDVGKVVHIWDDV